MFFLTKTLWVLKFKLLQDINSKKIEMKKTRRQYNKIDRLQQFQTSNWKKIVSRAARFFFWICFRDCTIILLLNSSFLSISYIFLHFFYSHIRFKIRCCSYSLILFYNRDTLVYVLVNRNVRRIFLHELQIYITIHINYKRMNSFNVRTREKIKVMRRELKLLCMAQNTFIQSDKISWVKVLQ